MLRECYRPHFEYAPDGLSAREAWKLFTKEFRFLTPTTRDPERLAELVQHLIFKQQYLTVTPPPCPRHEVRMVMLGRMGVEFVIPKKKLSMQTLQIVGNGGRLLVAKGIFRCPVPACYFVAPVEDNALLSRAEVE